MDLKDAYFHVPIHQDLKPFLRHQIGDQIWEYQGGCFGLNVMPHIFMSIMKTFEKKWRQKGIQVYIYLDDILVIAPSKVTLASHMKRVVQDLLLGGFKINLKKSQLEASQLVEHLGFQINFKEGKLQLPSQKVKGLRKELGKFVTKSFMTKRQVSAILGQIRSNLIAMPFLRAFTSLLVKFLRERNQDPWDSKHQISKDIKDQLKEIKKHLENWSGRHFHQKPTRFLHSDSSTLGWGGLDITTGKFVQEYWREKSSLHINIKEMIAAINTVRSLSQKGETVSLTETTSDILLSAQGGETKPLQQVVATPLQLVNKSRHYPSSNLGTLRKMLSRPHLKVGTGQGRLYLRPQSVQRPSKIFQDTHNIGDRLVCFPRQQTIEQVCLPVAPLASLRGGCSTMSSGQYGRFICKPPLVNHLKISPKIKTVPKCPSFNGAPLLGFSHMVAPINKMKVPNTPCLRINPYMGMFKKG